ncbi:hypothetical protein [Desulfobulbus alkaliphilus]|uniref:hypothetical protein n=1 Tax=Desulfobulbus alkaliphilus TaxID=869814 RepID=UPI00196397ED|nr:hypothetical protein [Desulfobulbus alkaliphilus]
MLKHISTIPRLVLLLLLTGPIAVSQANDDPVGIETGWDKAVHSLLASGLFGFVDQEDPGLTIDIRRSENMLKGLSPDHPTLEGQAITFSYEGSSGVLGFSAGYILTSQPDAQQPDTLLLDLDPANSWYLALDLSRSYQLDDNFSLQLGHRTMVMKNPFDADDGHVFSMLFNIPLSYRNFLTIAPEIQWTRPAAGLEAAERTPPGAGLGKQAGEDVFYGGLSISFSY